MDNDQWRFMHDQGLTFFGRIAASVSHELKNHLAVINEQTGLMSDLLHMAGQGKPPALQRLSCLSRDIADQVRKADETIKNFGRFSHSVDRHYCSVDLCELVEIMIGVAGRLATARGVFLTRGCGPCPVMILTNPFLLEQLVFLCLEHLLSHGEDGDELIVDVSALSTKAALDLSFAHHALTSVPDSVYLRFLSKSIHAELLSLRDQSKLRIELPLAIPGQRIPGDPKDE
jgi:signal transduction histidine kinase